MQLYVLCIKEGSTYATFLPLRLQALRRLRRLCSEDSYTPSLSPLRDTSGFSPETEAALSKPARYVSPFGPGHRARPVTAEDVRAQVASASGRPRQNGGRAPVANLAGHFALGPEFSLPHTPDDGDDRFAITRKSKRLQKAKQTAQQQPSVYELLARLSGETYI